MIRSFRMQDLAAFRPNAHSHPQDVLDDLQNPAWWNFSLLEGERVQAIICFFHQGGGEWAGFFLIGEGFNAANCKELKRFYSEMVKEHRPTRLWTLSRDEVTIDRWHRFLGMHRESSMMLEGEHFTIWQQRW